MKLPNSIFNAVAEKLFLLQDRGGMGHPGYEPIDFETQSPKERLLLSQRAALETALHLQTVIDLEEVRERIIEKRFHKYDQTQDKLAEELGQPKRLPQRRGDAEK